MEDLLSLLQANVSRLPRPC